MTLLRSKVAYPLAIALCVKSLISKKLLLLNPPGLPFNLLPRPSIYFFYPPPPRPASPSSRVCLHDWTYAMRQRPCPLEWSSSTLEVCLLCPPLQGLWRALWKEVSLVVSHWGSHSPPLQADNNAALRLLTFDNSHCWAMTMLWCQNYEPAIDFYQHFQGTVLSPIQPHLQTQEAHLSKFWSCEIHSQI